jgi:hypothetical protein
MGGTESPVRLERSTFRTSRLLDFASEKELTAQSVLLVLDQLEEVFGTPTLGARPHFALHGWLRQARKALALRGQIEDAAAEWQAADRVESRMWPEERILDAIREIEVSGVSIADVENRATISGRRLGDGPTLRYGR